MKVSGLMRSTILDNEVYFYTFGELYKQNDKMSENSKKEEHSI